MRPIDHVKARQFAIEIVTRLRESGFEALWAGGCVRDQLMGCQPKDYDIATNAQPEQIREVFGHRRTLAIGASFGVIVVLGPKGAGQIDVATFRRDATYSDGRHPDAVSFCDAEEDARRRDFTINGLFYNPIEQRVIDYVGGQEDLERRLIRAIGDPAARFSEDKLRMLRALRFASTLGFEIDPATFAALRELAPQIQVVSAERITEELRRMLAPASVRKELNQRRRALELLRASRLLPQILPQSAGVFPDEESVDDLAAAVWERTLRMADQLPGNSFAAAVAMLIREIYLAKQLNETELVAICRQWRMSNEETQIVIFCLRHEGLIRAASCTRWPLLQPVLIDCYIEPLLDYAEAVARVLDGGTAEIDYCRERLQWPIEKLNPPPLVRGDELREVNIPPGPIYKELLEGAREAQLMGSLTTKEQALNWIRDRWAARNDR